MPLNKYDAEKIRQYGKVATQLADMFAGHYGAANEQEKLWLASMVKDLYSLSNNIKTSVAIKQAEMRV